MSKRALPIIVFLLGIMSISPSLVTNTAPVDAVCNLDSIVDVRFSTPLESSYLVESDSDFIGLGATGIGSVDDPFVIENRTFSSTTTCLIIKDTRSHFAIQNCVFTSPYGSNGYGIHLYNASNGIIRSCQFFQKVSGLFLYKGTNTSMEGLVISDCLYYGIDSFYSNYCNVTDCVLSNNNGAGVVTYRSDYWRFQNTTLSHNGDYGINMHMSTYCTVLNCTISETRGYGTIFTNAHYSVVNHTNIIDNHGKGSWLQITNYMEFDHCNISGNSGEGISGYNSGSNTIRFTEMNDNQDAFRLGGCSSWKIINCSLMNNGIGISAGSVSNWNHDFSNSTINGKPILHLNGEFNNTVNGNDYSQIILLSCDNITVSGGDFSGLSMGVAMAYSTNCIAQDVVATDMTYSGLMIRESSDCVLRNCSTLECKGGGIIIIDADYSTIESCLIQDCSRWGVWLLRGDNTLFEANMISGNRDYGVFLQETEVNNFTDNVFINNGVYLEWDWNHVFENNSVDGKSLVYLWNEVDTNYDGSNFGQIILASCDNVTVSDAVLGGFAYAIQLDSCTDCVIANTTFQNTLEYGVLMYQSQSCLLVDCNLTTSSGAGVHIAYSTDCGLVNCRVETIQNHGVYSRINTNTTLLDNQFLGCGPFIYGSNIENFVLTCSGNYVNSKPFGAFFGQVGGLIDCSSYGQILLGNCTDVSVESVLVANTSVGVQIGGSYGCQIDSANITGCTMSAVDIRASSHCTVYNSHIWNNTGIGIEFLGGGSDSAITLCVIEGNQEEGVHLDGPESASVEQNIIRYNLKTGLDIGYCLYASITSNEIYENQGDGVYWQNPYLSTISGNVVSNNSESGFRLLSGQNSTFESNTVINNAEGVLFQGINYFVITENVVTGNDGIGCFIAMAKGNTLYDNLWAWNNDGNVIDYGYMYEETEQNVWDDGVWRGNVWGDYNGTGWYWIPGRSGAVDHYPERADVIAPTFDNPPDIFYEGGTFNNQIVWNPSDTHPLLYRVLCNNKFISSSNWNGSDITIDIDGHSPGVYTYTLSVYDTCYNTMMDSVRVTVTDTTSPIIDSPSDVVSELGQIGNTISWITTDAYPHHFEVLLDASVNENGAWIGQNISVSIGELSLGPHNLTLVVYDVGGNSASDSVIITIEDTTVPTISSPSDISFEEGTQGQLITWTTSDYLPNTYTLYRDGSMLSSELWTNGNFIVLLDSLPAGTYNYTLSVDDTQGNVASDTVMVTVTSTATSTTSTTTTSTTPSPTPGGSPTINPILIGTSIGLGAIVGILSTVVLFRSGRIGGRR
ncbi:MAG: right-handed parallel beta-helix repeat-containing protein [Candidatus Thorarchaeota archaeon]